MANSAKSSGRPAPAAPAPIKIVVDNRRARFLYELSERVECGIVLTGTEVKSLRDGRINLGDAYGFIDPGGEAWLVDCHISPYTHGTYTNHDPMRRRKLLLHKREARRLRQQVREKGLTLVPTKVYLKRGRVKVELALAKGKKLYDKRQAIKERDSQRDLRHAIR